MNFRVVILFDFFIERNYVVIKSFADYFGYITAVSGSGEVKNHSCPPLKISIVQLY